MIFFAQTNYRVVSRDEMFRTAFLQQSPQLTAPAAPFKGGFAAFS
jgi:hypothetical protein